MFVPAYKITQPHIAEDDKIQLHFCEKNGK
jgi:hypothetical protein